MYPLMDIGTRCSGDARLPLAISSSSNWGLVDPLKHRVRDKVRKREMLEERAETDFREWMEASGIEGPSGARVEAPVRAKAPLS